jgi:hypothetical protein
VKTRDLRIRRATFRLAEPSGNALESNRMGLSMKPDLFECGVFYIAPRFK